MGVYYAKAIHAAMAMLMGGSVRTFDNDLMRQVCIPAVTSLCICTHLSARATLPRTTHIHTHTHAYLLQAWEQKPTTLHVVSCVVMFLGATVIAILFAFLTTIVVKTANASWAFFNRQASVKEQVRALQHGIGMGAWGVIG